MKKLIIGGFLVMFLSSVNLMAEWEPCSSGMNSGSVYALLVIGNSIYAGTSSGVYISANNGSSWVQTTLNNSMVYSLVFNGSNIFASTMDHGVYRSSNNGSSWSQTALSEPVQSLTVSGSDVYATNNLNVFKSIDNGSSWQIVFTSQYPTVGSLNSNGSNSFIGEHGVFVSANNGANWVQTLNTSIYIVNALAVNGSNVFAGALGVYHSADNGATWSQVSLSNLYIRALYIYGNNIFAGTSENGVYVSNNNGTSWFQRSEGLGATPPIIRSFCISGGYVFAGTWQQNVYRRLINEFISVKPISSNVPGDYSLSQNYPNPFNPSTKIKFELPPHGAGSSSEFVQVKLYDNIGRVITTLVSEELLPGKYEVEWNASDYPSGVYYYKLLTGEYSNTKKMILLK